jgi:hypothetical protein
MGFDPATGKLLAAAEDGTSGGGVAKEEAEEKSGGELGDLQLMKEIDAFINNEARERMDSEAHLKRMLECSDKALQIHHPVAKKKVRPVHRHHRRRSVHH